MFLNKVICKKVVSKGWCKESSWWLDNLNMSWIIRKPVFEALDQVLHKPGCIAKRRLLEAQNFGFRKSRDCTFYVAKTKAVISCSVTVQLICAFVLACAKSRFYHDMAHIGMRYYTILAVNNKDTNLIVPRPS